MPNGFTDPDAVHCGQQNSASTSTFLFAGSPPVEGFSGSGAPIWYVGRPTNYDTVTKGDVVGTISWGLNGGQGVIGWGGELFGTGVMGLGGVNWPVYGPTGGQMSQSGGRGGVFLGGDGHAAFTLPDNVKGGLGSPIQAGFGVTGWGGSGQSAADVPTNATNVVPVNPGVGVVGVGGQEPQTGTVPSDTANPGSGVVGMATSAFIGLSPFNIWTQNGVVGIGPTGVYGFSETGLGVLGASLSKGGAAGVAGVGAHGGIGVTGFVPVSNTKADAQTVAIFGWVGGTPKQSGKGPYAGWFQGPVVVDGDFTVMAPGTKSMAVPFSDGSHRRLYCMESPECWFEDFGEAKLVKGKAQIKLPRDFVAVINAGSYHVFLTPYGASNGLYVSKRTRQGFMVEEQGHGKSSLNFSFRIVGKQKDVKAERFAKVTVSKAPQSKPKPPKLPALKDPKVKVKPPTKPSIGQPPPGLLSAGAGLEAASGKPVKKKRRREHGRKG